MSLPQTTGGYALAPGEGEALWFNGGLGVLRATGDQTEGRFAAMELLAPKGFGSPLHIHRREDEFFVVLSGEVRVRHGEDVIEAVAGSVVYGPRDVAHAFHVDSEEARMLLLLGPAGVEGVFGEGGPGPQEPRGGALHLLPFVECRQRVQVGRDRRGIPPQGAAPDLRLHDQAPDPVEVTPGQREADPGSRQDGLEAFSLQ